MAREPDSDQKARWLRAVAFLIQRKRPAAEALAEQIGQESRGGKSKLWREMSQVLEQDGFVPALQTGGFIGDEAATLLTLLVDHNDHRLLADALSALALRFESGLI